MLLAAVMLGFGIEALAAVVLIPTLWVLVRRPQRGVLLLALLVPFNGVLQITSLPSVITPWKEVLAGFVLAATFVCPLDARASPAQSRLIPTWVPALAALVVIGFASAGWFHTSENLFGLKDDFYWVILPIAVWRCPFDERERDRLVSILMGTGFLCALMGLGQQVIGDVRLHELGYQYGSTIRSAGSILRSFSTFSDPFAFAFFMMIVVLVATPVALSAPSRLRNQLYLLALPIYMLGLFSSIVRAAVVGAAVGLAYLGLRNYRVLLWSVPLALLAVLVLGVLGGAITSQFASSSSLGERQLGWQQNLVELTRHPLGVGIGTTGAAAEKAASTATTLVSAQPYNPDNYYFKVLYELGVLGLWAFVVFLFGAFLATHRAANAARPRDGPLLDGIAATILGVASASLVANLLDSFPANVYFWLILGIAAALEADRRIKARTPDEDAFIAD